MADYGRELEFGAAILPQDFEFVGAVSQRHPEAWGGCSDSIRSKGFRKDHELNVRWLRAARRVLKPDGTLWVSGTHHIIFSLGFALQRLGFRVINSLVWHKTDPAARPTHSLH